MPDLTAGLSLAVAEETFVTASTNMVVAEETSRTAELQPAIAATITPYVDADVAVAATYGRDAAVDVFCDGSTYLTPLLRVVIADETLLTADADVTIAGTSTATATLNVSLTDVVRIVVEPNDPKPTPLLTLDDLTVTDSNAIESATDLAAAGVQVGDVLELYDGANRGNYLIRGIDRNVAFVSETFFAVLSTGPFSGEVRTRQSVAAARTVALVLDRAIYLAPFRLSCRLDVAVD